MKDGINRLAAAATAAAAALYIISIELSFVCLYDRTSRALAPLALFYVDILLYIPRFLFISFWVFFFLVVAGGYWPCMVTYTL